MMMKHTTDKIIKLNIEDFDKALINDEIILTDDYGNIIVCEVKERASNTDC